MRGGLHTAFKTALSLVAIGRKTLLVVFAFGVFLYSCTKDVGQPGCTTVCYSTPVSYKDEIKPLIATHCVTNQGPGTGCHDAWIFNYDEIKKVVATGDFARVISTKEMPEIPNDFGITGLTDEEIRKFECWICDGAPNN